MLCWDRLGVNRTWDCVLLAGSSWELGFVRSFASGVVGDKAINITHSPGDTAAQGWSLDSNHAGPWAQKLRQLVGRLCQLSRWSNHNLGSAIIDIIDIVALNLSSPDVCPLPCEVWHLPRVMVTITPGRARRVTQIIISDSFPQDRGLVLAASNQVSFAPLSVCRIGYLSLFSIPSWGRHWRGRPGRGWCEVPSPSTGTWPIHCTVSPPVTWHLGRPPGRTWLHPYLRTGNYAIFQVGPLNPRINL